MKINPILRKANIPLTAVVKGDVLYLVEVTEVAEYEKGAKTDKLWGYRYVVVDSKTFDKVSVKVAGLKPIITMEQLEAAEQHVKVAFENAYGCLYTSSDDVLEISFKAASINIVK